MPNYTRNILVVRGAPECLKYFYERNRVTEDDVKYTSDDGDVRHLSFGKCVARDITKVISAYISKNYEVKKESTIKIFDLSIPLTERNLMVSIWGTKWDASDAKAILSEIDDKGILTYHFDTAWSYPRQWLITVSKIFPKLTFDIIYSIEDDSYDMVYEKHFENGKETNVSSYSSVKLSIEKAGGTEKLVNDIIAIFENENLMMNTSGEEKVHWLEYCRREWGNSLLISSMMDEHNIHEEFDLSGQFCFDSEFEKFFLAKLQEKLA
jgi:hypothetical protein